MANTYAQIHIHSVLCVENRNCIIIPPWRDYVYKYITEIIEHSNHRLLAINGMPDHIHILFGLRPAQSLSKPMQEVKSNSAKWINLNRFVKGRFAWQEGYGAFSYSKSEVPKVISYIMNQQKVHQTNNFDEEYRHLLEEFKVEFDGRSLQAC